jgi:transcription factor MBP1
LALAKQYGVEDLLRPIIDYVPTAVSPPPAPKHAVAPPTKTKKDKDGKGLKDAFGAPLKTGPMSAAALQAQAHLSAQRAASGKGQGQQRPVPESTPDADTTRSGDESISGTPGEDDDSSSDTPSPVASGAEDGADGMDVSMEVDGSSPSQAQPGSSGRKRTAAMMMADEAEQHAFLQRARGQSAVRTPRQSPGQLPMGMGDQPLGPEGYTDIILNYFISETTQIPSILVNPPSDFDPNTRIDEDGHSALHWACAMGRVRVVKLLLTAGASIFAGNNAEQTPLMRSVMFSNNYDVRKFPELYELLHRSTLNIDKHNRTVFHHIANLALTKGKTHAARYYMETILSRLSDYPQELADVINFQDEDGETALTLAARARSRRLVKALLDHGADPKIKNRDFKSAEDYILEDERFRSSPVQGGASSSIREKPLAPQLYSSEAARLAGGQCLADITTHMQSLARSFDTELQGKERDILQAKALLTNIHNEVTEASRIVQDLTNQAAPMEGKKRELEALQQAQRDRIGESMKRGLDKWFAEEVAREARWREGRSKPDEETGDLQETTRLPDGGVEVVQAEEDRLRWEVEEKRRRRQELVNQFVQAQAEVSAKSGSDVASSQVAWPRRTRAHAAVAGWDGREDCPVQKTHLGGLWRVHINPRGRQCHDPAVGGESSQSRVHIPAA